MERSDFLLRFFSHIVLFYGRSWAIIYLILNTKTSMNTFSTLQHTHTHFWVLLSVLPLIGCDPEKFTHTFWHPTVPYVKAKRDY